MKKELKISAIENGTVIDHIPALATFTVASILNLSEIDNVISVASNLKSSKMGKKGIIKIGGKTLTPSEVNKISVVAPQATVNIIEGYAIKKKIQVEIPDSFEDIIKCNNPNCITNHEHVKTKFKVVSKQPLQARCYYCERTMSEKECIKGVDADESGME